MISTEGNDPVCSKAQEVLEQLDKLHPELTWTLFEIGDYDQSAELDAPEILVSFSSEAEQIDSGLVDPYADIFGKACLPSQWGLSEEAAQILVAYNKVFLAKYPNFDAPRYLAEEAQRQTDASRAQKSTFPKP